MYESIDLQQLRSTVMKIYRLTSKLNLYTSFSERPDPERIHSELHYIKQIVDNNFETLKENYLKDK